ncbi:MAG: hypothetical protein U1E65_22725 [Myxococcota bacterium]
MSPLFRGISLAFALFYATGALAQETPEPSPTPPPPPGSPKGHSESRPSRPSKDPEQPAVRAVAGNWGMFFRFGGLATLDAGNAGRNLDGLLVTQVGMRAVLDDDFILPFYVGTGFQHLADANSNATADTVSFDGGVGFEYHFRVWRRISPFVGANVGLGIFKANADPKATIGVGFGPSLGVEYYIADRVSLIAQYILTLQASFRLDVLTTISFQTLSGGAMNLVFYF